MRNKFDQELETLNSDLTEMGILIEKAIVSAVDCLIKKDVSLADEAMHYEQAVDEKEKDIETRCLKLLLQQQPVATDLRMISTALKMITDMERIGDQASDIAELAIRLSQNGGFGDLLHIPQMANATVKMVKQSVDAFVAGDLTLAQQVIEYDDVVDGLFNNVKDDLIALIRKDTQFGEQIVDLLMVAKYFERIGDHAVNIAEWVVFSITGEHKNTRIV